MRLLKSLKVKTNRVPRDPHAASLRMFRGIYFDEKRHALATFQAWQDLREWQQNDNDDRDLDDNDY